MRHQTRKQHPNINGRCGEFKNNVASKEEPSI